MAEVSEANYYWRWFIQVWRQTIRVGWAQFMAVITAVAVLILDVVYGATSDNKFRPEVHAVVVAYLTILIGYILYEIARAPLILDRERANEIDHLKAAVPPPAAVAFEKLEFTLRQDNPSTTRCNMSVNVRFSSGKKPATLHNFRLRSEAPKFEHFDWPAQAVYGHSRSHGSNVIALGPNDIKHARLVFDFGVIGTSKLDDPQMASCLEFEDASKRYREKFPERLYKK